MQLTVGDAVRQPKTLTPALGRPRPRIAPPVPLRHRLKELRLEATKLGITLLPGQEQALKYISAQGPGGRHAYFEVAVVAARQNGKTTLVKPVVTDALRQGKKVMHVADKRELPRQMFKLIADALSDEPELFPQRRGKTIWPRHGAGQEEIVLRNGGEYRIAAASSGGARGWMNDLVLIDETREFVDLDTEQAIMSTTKMSKDPQVLYLSNAGSERSVWLNNIRARGQEQDPALAYLEWSANPDRDPGDVRGWQEANWAMGHYPGVNEDLARSYARAQLTNTMPQFETENLCRWVISLEPPVVTQEAWAKCHQELPGVARPWVAINVDPGGTRVSAVLAWQLADGSTACRTLADVTGEPVDLELLGPQLKRKVQEAGAFQVGYDPWTDADLARWFTKSRVINGRDYAAASQSFASQVDAGTLGWDEAYEVGEDLKWMTRRETTNGSWMAVKAKDGRPVTAGLAAIRATWMASNPTFGEAAIW